METTPTQQPGAADALRQELRCLDCSKPYSLFSLDTVLPRSQWLAIHPQGTGVLCANCIVDRAEKLPGATALQCRIEGAFPDDAEVAELRAWKESMLAVENEWDVQALATSLGATPGQSCREVISKRIPELLAEVAELRAWAESNDEQYHTTCEILTGQLEEARGEAGWANIQVARLEKALRSIRDGAPAPVAIANRALTPEAP